MATQPIDVSVSMMKLARKVMSRTRLLRAKVRKTLQ